MSCTRDILGFYRLTPATTEEEILRAAEEILARRLNTGEALTDPSAAGTMLRARLGHLDHEVFCVVFLDTRHRVIAIENLFRGTIDGCEVHPREIVKQALVHNAAAVIVSHNHPSGSDEPSAADHAVTKRIQEALRLVDVRLLDHILVARSKEPVSFARRGWV